MACIVCSSTGKAYLAVGASSLCTGVMTVSNVACLVLIETYVLLARILEELTLACAGRAGAAVAGFHLPAPEPTLLTEVRSANHRLRAGVADWLSDEVCVAYGTIG